MTEPMGTPKTKRSIDPRSPIQNYKVVFSILRPSNKQQSTDRDASKKPVILASPKTTQYHLSHRTSAQKYTVILPSSAKCFKGHSNSNIADPIIPAERTDLRIDLKYLRKMGSDSTKAEDTSQNKIMFHSQRKMIQGSPEGTIRHTSRCLEIQDIILSAPYFNSLRASNKVIKLKRPSK